MEIAITGASGLIGSALSAALRAAGDRPVALVRRAVVAGEDAIEWNPAEGRIDAAALEGMHGVVHLAGAGIGDKRWTDAYKREVLDSRTGPTRLLTETLASLQRPPAVLVSGSAIGYYGDRGDEVLTETSGPGDLFLSEVCVAWEAAAKPAVDAGIRVAYTAHGHRARRPRGCVAQTAPAVQARRRRPHGLGPAVVELGVDRGRGPRPALVARARRHRSGQCHRARARDQR